MYKRLILIIGLLQILGPSMANQPPGTEILWDTYGVPHITGQDIAGMYYGFGWAQMHNHANLLLRLYGQARGKAAEYWGPDELGSDRMVVLFRIPEIARQINTRQDQEFSSYSAAFVRGINDFAGHHPEAIDPSNRCVLPVRSEDVIMHSLRVVYQRFVAGENLEITSQLLRPGSNAMAIAPSRSASGNPLLLANPHLYWGDLYTFFEAHLCAPGFNAYGASIVGFPVLNIAFNQQLGWTHTVNTIDACDRYQLKMQGGGYILDGKVMAFEKRSVIINVKTGNGPLRKDTMLFDYSRQGPVIGTNGDKAYAISIAGLENPNLFLQWHRMAAAQDWSQFESALKMMQLPMFNVVYADKAGNILYLFDGNVPDRSSGDWDFWNGTVDGTSSKFIWRQTLPYGDLPKVFDPATGFVQNANDPPWTCTYPLSLDPKAFRGYLSPSGMALRPQRAVKMIKDEHHISLGQLVGFKLNTEMEAADRFVGDLLTAARQYPDSLTSAAADVLAKWDRCANADSRGAVLFARWFDKLTDSSFAEGWSKTHPLETPTGLHDPRQAAALLRQAATETIADFGRLDVPWGDVYRFRLNNLDYPANGGPERYGIYRTIYFARDRDKKNRALAGDSYVAAIEFGKEPKAYVLLSYGNASQPGSKHIGDQLELLSQKRMREAWLLRDQILKNLEEKEELTVSK